MSDLERRLDALGADVAYPPTPDLLSAVLARVERRPRVVWRRALVVAAATVAVVFAGVVAVSADARSAIRDWLDIGGVTIERVEELPATPTRARPFFGERVTLDDAWRLAAFRVLVPDAEGLREPDEVYYRDFPSGGSVTLLYGSLARPRLALTQWLGQSVAPVEKKVVPGETRVERTLVSGKPAVWLSGAPHEVVIFGRGREAYPERLFLAGNVLVWEDDGRAFRLEADVDRERAVEIAESVR